MCVLACVCVSVYACVLVCMYMCVNFSWVVKDGAHDARKGQAESGRPYILHCNPSQNDETLRQQR